MRLNSSVIIALFLAGLLSGCAGETNTAPQAYTQVPADPVLAGAVPGPAGQELSTDDRRLAGQAQLAAVAEGKRRSWKSKSGAFGYIIPESEQSGISGKCRNYSHTIYVQGRATSAKGQACQKSPGIWQIVS